MIDCNSTSPCSPKGLALNCGHLRDRLVLPLGASRQTRQQQWSLLNTTSSQAFLLSNTSLLRPGGQTQDTLSLMAPHRPRPCEVHTVCQALAHLVTEEADADALQVLGRDLQGQGHQVKAMQPAHRTSAMLRLL